MIDIESYVDHIEPERWGPLLIVADWYAFCKALYKGRVLAEMCESYTEMSRAVGVKKPQEAQKAKASWA